jgi:ABC transporter with metal-binding/Fe-S-binding domain ATP-binding protein
VKVASLFSGGKDSTYAIMRAKEMGHSISCVVALRPMADDSLLFHYPNTWITEILAEAMRLPLVGCSVSGRSKADEVAALEQAVATAKSMYHVEGLVSGGISSRFQRQAIEDVCSRLRLAAISPLWNLEPVAYMNKLLDIGFKIMIVAVSAMGLGKEWLGTTIDRDALVKLTALSERHGFNLNFEGGEAETLVTDCPLYEKRLEVRRARTTWDGQRGIFEIQEAVLVEK